MLSVCFAHSATSSLRRRAVVPGWRTLSLTHRMVDVARPEVPWNCHGLASTACDGVNAAWVQQLTAHLRSATNHPPGANSEALARLWADRSAASTVDVTSKCLELLCVASIPYLAATRTHTHLSILQLRALVATVVAQLVKSRQSLDMINDPCAIAAAYWYARTQALRPASPSLAQGLTRDDLSRLASSCAAAIAGWQNTLGRQMATATAMATTATPIAQPQVHGGADAPSLAGPHAPIVFSGCVHLFQAPAPLHSGLFTQLARVLPSIHITAMADAQSGAHFVSVLGRTMVALCNPHHPFVAAGVKELEAFVATHAGRQWTPTPATPQPATSSHMTGALGQQPASAATGEGEEVSRHVSSQTPSQVAHATNQLAILAHHGVYQVPLPLLAAAIQHATHSISTLCTPVGGEGRMSTPVASNTRSGDRVSFATAGGGRYGTWNDENGKIKPGPHVPLRAAASALSLASTSASTIAKTRMIAPAFWAALDQDISHLLPTHRHTHTHTKHSVVASGQTALVLFRLLEGAARGMSGAKRLSRVCVAQLAAHGHVLRMLSDQQLVQLYSLLVRQSLIDADGMEVLLTECQSRTHLPPQFHAVLLSGILLQRLDSHPSFARFVPHLYAASFASYAAHPHTADAAFISQLHFIEEYAAAMAAVGTPTPIFAAAGKCGLTAHQHTAMRTQVRDQYRAHLRSTLRPRPQSQSLWQHTIANQVASELSGAANLPRPLTEFVTENCLSVDMAWPEAKVAVEIEGFPHFLPLEPTQQLVRCAQVNSHVCALREGTRDAHTQPVTQAHVPHTHPELAGASLSNTGDIMMPQFPVAISRSLVTTRGGRSYPHRDTGVAAFSKCEVAEGGHSELGKILHSAILSPTRTPRTQFKHAILRAQGWRVCSVPLLPLSEVLSAATVSSEGEVRVDTKQQHEAWRRHVTAHIQPCLP